MFVLAFGIHFVLFRGFRFVPRTSKAVEAKKRMASSTAPEADDGGAHLERCMTRRESRPQQKMDVAAYQKADDGGAHLERYVARREARPQQKMDVAYQKGHWAAMLRHWYAQRDDDATTPGQLLQVVEAMQRLNLASASKVHEISHFLSKHPGSCHIEFINRLFTSLVKSMDMDVIAGLFECLPKLKINPDSRTYEMLIQLHFTMQNSDEMLRLAKDMEANGVAPSVATQVTLLKDALKKGDLDMAIPLYCQVHESCPSHVESTLASLACQSRQGTRITGCFESKKIPLRPEMLDLMVRANLQMRDRKLATRISKLCRTFGIEVDSHNKHVFVGSGSSQGNAGSSGENDQTSACPTLAEHVASDTVQQTGCEKGCSAQQQQEPSGPRCRTLHNTENHWEQDHGRSHWESGGAHENRSGKWVAASGDGSWEWDHWSWGSTRKHWAKGQTKHLKQYKEGTYNQLMEVNKNNRKTWVPTENMRPSRFPLPTALVGDTAVQSPDGVSIKPPPGLELEIDMATGIHGEHHKYDRTVTS